MHVVRPYAVFMVHASAPQRCSPAGLGRNGLHFARENYQAVLLPRACAVVCRDVVRFHCRNYYFPCGMQSDGREIPRRRYLFAESPKLKWKTVLLAFCVNRILCKIEMCAQNEGKQNNCALLQSYRFRCSALVDDVTEVGMPSARDLTLLNCLNTHKTVSTSFDRGDSKKANNLWRKMQMLMEVETRFRLCMQTKAPPAATGTLDACTEFSRCSDSINTTIMHIR